MKKIAVLLIVLAFIVSIGTPAMASWAKCSGCHNSKVAPDKETLVKKFTSIDAFVKGAKEAKNPMMNAIKGDEAAIKAAAIEIGLK